MANGRVLLTGGAGYIGSHTYIALVAAGYDPVILDNFVNSHPGVIARLEKITGKRVTLEKGDVTGDAFIKSIFAKYPITSVIHFAALKAVGESCEKPLLYYRENVCGLINLLTHMQTAGCSHLVYSSSATVYGIPEKLPIDEASPLKHINPYGHTKLMGEEIIGYAQEADPKLAVGILRYFNPVGAHASGTIGESPNGVPNNLMPYISQVAVGVRPHLQVFGTDYPTPDGTGVRDYIHVVDLAEGHVAALRYLEDKNIGFIANLGTGHGYSVLDVVKAFEKASGKTIPYQAKPRRAGDASSCYADPTFAEKLLGWKANRDIDTMCADTWRWQSQNPRGFEE